MFFENITLRLDVPNSDIFLSASTYSKIWNMHLVRLGSPNYVQLSLE